MQAWFRGVFDVEASMVVEALQNGMVISTSSPSRVIFKGVSPRVELSEAGFALEFPLIDMPRFSGDRIVATLWANTGSYALDRWAIKLTIDGSTARYVEGSLAVNSVLFGPPVIKALANGMISTSAVRLQSATEPGLTSNRLHVATLTLEVTDTTQTASTESIVGCTVLYMVNTGNYEFAKNQLAPSLRIVLARVERVAIYSFVQGFDLVDWDAVGGGNTTLSISTRAVYNRFGVPDTAVTPQCDASADPSVVAVRSCSAVSASPGTKGNPTQGVNVSFAGLKTMVFFRVWALHSASVNVLNTKLRRMSTAGDCAGSPVLYQRTICSITVAMSTGDTSRSLLEVDVTNQVEVVLDDETCVTVSNASARGPRMVQGIKPGISALGVARAKVPVRKAAVFVLEDGVNVTGLSVVALTGVEWQPLSAANEQQTITSRLQFLSERLTDTRQEATLMVQALFSDGTTQRLAPRDGVIMESLRPRVLSVRPEGDVWSGSRQVDGEPSFCGDLVRARWMRCNGSIGEGTGVMDVELPRVISAWMVSSALHITSPGDPSALPPRSFPTSTTVVSARVRFSDGSERELISDQRTSIRIVNQALSARLDGKRLVALGNSTGEVLLEATFQGFGSVTAQLRITVHAKSARSASLRCARGPCVSIQITSPADPATKPPFLFPSSFQGFRTFMTFEGSSAETEYTGDPRWSLAVAFGAELATVQGRVVNASDTGPGQVGIFAIFGGGFDLMTLPVVIDVLRSAALSATVSCGATDCTQVRIANESDPATAAPLSIPSSVDLSVHVLLADGRSVELPFDARTQYRIVEGGQFARMDNNRAVAIGIGPSDSGRVRILAGFPGVFNFSTPAVQLRVVGFKELGVKLDYYGGGSGDGQTFHRLHCSEGFEGVDAKVSAALSDGSVVDVTLFTSMQSTNSSVVATRGAQANGVQPGTATLRIVFAGVLVARIIAVENTSVHITHVSLAGVPRDIVGQPNTSAAIRVTAVFERGGQLTMSEQERGAPWLEAGWLTDALFTFASDASSALSVGKGNGRVTLQTNWHQAVVISARTSACDGFSAEGTISANPNLLPSADGDVDIGAATGLALAAVAVGSRIQVPVFLRSDGLLKSFEIRLLVDPWQLEVSSCVVGTDWRGAFSCTVNDPPGTVFIVGADVTSTLSGGRLSVASITANATGADIAEVSGTRVKVASSLGANLCTGCPIVAGRVQVRITGANPSTHRRKLETDPPKRVRRSMGGGETHGDANGDGEFDSADYLFAQEYSLTPEGVIGCPSFGGIACTAVATLSPWQLKQMDAVSDPFLPASAPSGNDLGFLLSVYSGKQRFFERWTVQSDSLTGLALRVRLLDKHGEPALERCSVRFILATTANKGAAFQTQSSTTPEGVLVLAEHKGDGWYGIDSIGPLQGEEEVPFVFMIETRDGTGSGDDAMRRFPFYATQLPPYNQFFPVFREFSAFKIHEFAPRTLTRAPSTPSSDPAETNTETNTTREPAETNTTREPAETNTTLEPAETNTTSEIGPTPTPDPTPEPTTPTTAAEVSVVAGSSLVALVGLVAVARRYWNVATTPAAAIGQRASTQGSTPVIRIRIRLPQQ